jgi:hypothetical protein
VTRARRNGRTPVEARKRLVAHVPWEDGESGPVYGPHDGDPVDLPAPCVRLLAGYWCPCGGSFIGSSTWEAVHFARVAAIDGASSSGYIDDREGGYEARVLHPSVEAQALLAQQIEELPLGAVVERRGVGIALRFGDVEDALVGARSGLDVTDPF